ncbi:MAG: winged helix-turn-helix transcriptional regulator [Roseibium sp.]|nr:winged helix-turn-helix transcriptional regulator [Roseibium sp.]
MLYLQHMTGNGSQHDKLRRDIADIGGQCLGRATRQTANRLTRHYNRYLAPYGLEVTQFTVLCAIALDAAPSASALAAVIGIERSTLNRNLKPLESAGLISRTAGHGRTVRYCLSDKGLALLARAHPAWRKAQDALTQHLPPSDPEALHDALKRVRRAVKAASADGQHAEPDVNLPTTDDT